MLLVISVTYVNWGMSPIAYQLGMNNQIFIFTENIRVRRSALFFKQKFNGVCCGHKLKRLELSFKDEKVNLAIGYYIFKIVVNRIDSHILYGDIVSYKFFKE